MKKQMLVFLTAALAASSFADGPVALCPPSHADSPGSTVDLSGNWKYVSNVNRNGRFRGRFQVLGIDGTPAPVSYYWTDDPNNCSENAAVMVPQTSNAKRCGGVPSASAPDVYIGGCTVSNGLSKFTAYARPGSYMVAIIDPNNVIPESNEQNNVIVFGRLF